MYLFRYQNVSIQKGSSIRNQLHTALSTSACSFKLLITNFISSCDKYVTIIEHYFIAINFRINLSLSLKSVFFSLLKFDLANSVFYVQQDIRQNDRSNPNSSFQRNTKYPMDNCELNHRPLAAFPPLCLNSWSACSFLRVRGGLSKASPEYLRKLCNIRGFLQTK